MKKILLSLVMMLACFSAKAQITANVRAGAGYNSDNFGLNGVFQVNIPFKSGGRLTFSPSVEADIPVGYGYSTNILLPLKIGYKIPLGKDFIFFPKIGPALGLDIDAYSDMFNVGPSLDLAFEIKHFVVGINGYVSVKELEYDPSDDYFDHYGWRCPHNVSLTLGYKF